MVKNNQEIHYHYWSIPTSTLLQEFHNNNNTTTEQKNPDEHQASGLSSEEANLRLSKYGKNLVRSKKNVDSLSLLISQFKSPIIVIFIFASILFFFLGQTEDALIIISASRCHDWIAVQCTVFRVHISTHSASFVI